MLEIKNAVVVVVFIFIKHNGLCGRLADSIVCAHVTKFACTLRCLRAPYTFACTTRLRLCTQFVKAFNIYAYMLIYNMHKFKVTHKYAFTKVGLFF